MPKIAGAIANDDYTLAIMLNNHHQIIYDMRPRLQTVRFSELSDLERFKAIRVEYENTLVWDNLCQITIDEIINMIER
jgi:hypothetical protein